MKTVEEHILRHTHEMIDHAWSQIQKKHPELDITTQHRNSLSLTLETSQGAVFGVSTRDTAFASREKRNAIRTALAPASPEEHNVAVFLSPQGWLLVGCFTWGDQIVYPILEWTHPLDNQQLCRSFTFFLLDRFSDACRKHLESISQLEEKPDEHSATMRFQREQGILTRVARLSPSIGCVAVIDEDGFVLGMAGDSAVAEDTAGGLAQFAAAAKKELDKLGTASLTGMSFSGANSMVMMAPIASSGLTLAVSAHGPSAAAWAMLAMTSAGVCVAALLEETGRFWGTAGEGQGAPKRYRDSWFGHPKLVAKATFAALSHAQIFHLHSCRLLARAKTQNLRWFGGRADAMRAGLRPCRACRP